MPVEHRAGGEALHDFVGEAVGEVAFHEQLAVGEDVLVGGTQRF